MMPYILWTLLNLLVIFSIPAALQVFLSRRKRKWPGLVLPILSAVLSVVMAVSGTGAYIEFYTPVMMVQSVCWLLLLGNIPTVLLLLIYFFCRRRGKQKKELDKMNVQDLE